MKRVKKKDQQRESNTSYNRKAAFGENEVFNQHFTNISNTVTPVSSRKQLMTSMKKELLKIIDFDSSYIAVYAEDYLSCCCFTENLFPQVKSHVSPPDTFSCTGPLKQSKPFLIDYAQLNPALSSQLALAQLHQEAGFKTAVVIPLKMRGLLMGYLVISSFHDPHFKPSQLAIFEKIAAPIAIGVSNVLLYEKLLLAQSEIKKREREKSHLLAISQAVASIRDKEDLFKMLVERIQPLLGFEIGAQIFVIDPADNTASIFFPNIFAMEPAYLDLATQRFSIKDTPLKEVIEKGIIFPVFRESMAEEYPQFPVTRILQRLQIESAIIAPLRIGGTVIGTFQIFSSRREVTAPEQFPLIQAIADQLAVAVSNILSNEKLEQKAREIARLNSELTLQNNYLIEEVHGTHNFEEIISKSKLLADIFRNINLVSKTDTTVLLLGETGTGKELFARAIHNLSTRKNKPLIKLNCAALPSQLIESELFGHERGAFTGAIDKRIGKFEIADGSTLFLDEIGELPLELQAKLLRALQEKEIERLGSNKVIKINVRIIAATNRDLNKEVAAGRFRSDLYFRLNVFPIQLPPLRERKEDIPLLASHFIKKMEKKLGREFRGISNKALQELTDYNWPGNIRELEHVIERSAIVSKGKVLTTLYLPASTGEKLNSVNTTWPLKPWKEHEKEYILHALSFCNGRVSGAKGAARILDIPPTTLESKMRKLGIKKQHYTLE